MESIMRRSGLYVLVMMCLGVCLGAGKDSPVFDLDGNELQAGSPYYVMPLLFIPGGGGGLTLDSTNCPPHVVQENFYGHNGLPVTFQHKGGAATFVPLSTDLNIAVQANFTGQCNESTVWKVEYDVSIKNYAVSTGGDSISALASWFKIEKFGFSLGYKLVFCSTDGADSLGKPVCRDLGIYADQYNRRLVLTKTLDLSFAVVFKKAETDASFASA